MAIALEMAKQYLRVDTSEDDELISKMIESAEKTCIDILRLEGKDELSDPSNFDIAVLYALAYMYEHREEADYHVLNSSLKNLLGADRKEVF